MQIADIDLTKYSNQFSSYTELRLHENRSYGIGFLNGDMVNNVQATSGGISARVFNKGAWGFSCNPEMSNDGIESTLGLATRNAEFLASRCGDADARLPIAQGAANSDFTTNEQAMTQQEKIAFLKVVDDYIVANCPDIVARSVNMNCLDMEKKLYTSDGAAGHNTNTRAVVGISLTARNEQGQPVQLSQSVGKRGQFEDVFRSTDECLEAVDKLYGQLLDKRTAARPVAGYHDVILDPDLAGILAHEAIGHTTEADIVRAGSVAGDYLGQQVVFSKLEIVSINNDQIDVV